MTPVSKACESLITILKRNLTKHEKEYATFNNTIREHKEISLNIKGYDVSSESEIQELYGLAIITSSEYDKYILKLNEAQQKDTDEFQKEYYEAFIRMCDNIIDNLKYTKECEE